jgi:FtsH-binding integral membrane protein
MMLISFIMMYGVIFLNVNEANHIYLSTARTYMVLLMASPMAVVMMLMMGKMYPNKKLNTGIMLGAVVLFGLILTGLRTQTPIGEVQYMKAMIPSSGVSVPQDHL